MSISAINCTPIKPQVSFGKGDLVPVGERKPAVIYTNPDDILVLNGEESHALENQEAQQYELDKQEFAKSMSVNSQVEEKLIFANDVKKPVAAAAAIIGAGLTAFATGKILGSISTRFVKGLPELVEGNLKKVSANMQDKAARWVTTNPGKLAKVKNLAGRAIGSTEQFARNAYKKLAYFGVTENTPNKTAAAFRNMAGWTGVATILPGILTKDEDGDGIKDILQKSQNVYTGTKQSCAEALNTASRLAEIAQVFA